MQQSVLWRPRGNISDDIVRSLRNDIIDGGLPAGERINEVHISRHLGVSRTPLREALIRLGQEGALTSVPRVGWFVKPLSLEEFEQLYPIRSLLDLEALRLAGLPSDRTVEHLELINARMAISGEADEIIELDDQFHLALIEHCPNRILLEMIVDIMRRTRRYEVALMRESANVAVATDNHVAILAAVRGHNLDAVAAALRHNLTSGYEPIRSWLQNRAEDKTR